MMAKSERRFRQLADLLPQIVFETDLVGPITFANQFSIKAFGYTPEEVRAGINFSALIAPEDRPALITRFRENLTVPGRAAREWRVLRKDGSTFPVLMQAAAILENGAPIGVRGIAIDITERKATEAKIRETLSSLRKAYGGIIQVLSVASEVRDPYTAGHQRRVSDLARAIAQDMGLAPERVEGIRLAGASTTSASCPSPPKS